MKRKDVHFSGTWLIIVSVRFQSSAPPMKWERKDYINHVSNCCWILCIDEFFFCCCHWYRPAVRTWSFASHACNFTSQNHPRSSGSPKLTGGFLAWSNLRRAKANTVACWWHHFLGRGIIYPSKSKGLKRRGPCRGDPKSQFRRVIPTMPESTRRGIESQWQWNFENHHSRFLSVSLGFLWLPIWLLRSLGLLLGSPSWLSGSYIASTLDFSRLLSISLGFIFWYVKIVMLTGYSF